MCSDDPLIQRASLRCDDRVLRSRAKEREEERALDEDEDGEASGNGTRVCGVMEAWEQRLENTT